MQKGSILTGHLPLQPWQHSSPRSRPMAITLPQMRRSVSSPVEEAFPRSNARREGANGNQSFHTVVKAISFLQWLFRSFLHSPSLKQLHLLSVTPLTFASINMYNRPLSELRHCLDGQGRPIDVLCIQEITSQRIRNEPDIDLDGSNQTELSLFNRTSGLNAHAVFQNSLAGIIVLRSGVTVRRREIQPRAVTVQLTIDGPICTGHT